MTHKKGKNYISTIDIFAPAVRTCPWGISGDMYNQYFCIFSVSRLRSLREAGLLQYALGTDAEPAREAVDWI